MCVALLVFFIHRRFFPWNFMGKWTLITAKAGKNVVKTIKISTQEVKSWLKNAKSQILLLVRGFCCLYTDFWQKIAVIYRISDFKYTFIIKTLWYLPYFFITLYRKTLGAWRKWTKIWVLGLADLVPSFKIRLDYLEMWF